MVDTTDDDYDRIFSVNTRATFWIFREAAQKIRDGGRILGVSSNMVSRGGRVWRSTPRARPLSSSSSEFLPKNSANVRITVNAIAPGPPDQPHGLATFARHGSRDHAAQFSPPPSDIADVVAFLVSEDADWVTGQIIGVKCGIAAI